MSKFKSGKKKRDGGRFFAVPDSVLNGSAYIALSAHGRMLLWDLFAQYKGDNNGDLCAPYSLMQHRGWKSTHTLHNAKQELLNAGLIFETRKGYRPNKASLYAVTWQALDECGGKLDIRPCAFPRGAYRMKDPMPQLRQIASLNARVAATPSPLMH